MGVFGFNKIQVSRLRQRKCGVYEIKEREKSDDLTAISVKQPFAFRSCISVLKKFMWKNPRHIVTDGI